MAINVRELRNSQSFDENFRSGEGSATLEYWAEGSTNFDAVKTAVLANAPTTYQGMLAESYDMEPADNSPSNWFAEITYSSKKVEPGSYKISVDTSSGTLHLKQALSETRYPSSGDNAAPNRNGVIGEKEDGTIEGVDIVYPQTTVTISATIRSLYVTQGYVNAVSDLVGTVNQNPFLGYAAEVLLFTGFQGDINVGEDTQLSFSFLKGKHQTDLTVGDISSISKKAHQYLWVAYEPVDTETKALVRKPRAVYVNDVYRKASWSTLYINV